MQVIRSFFSAPQQYAESEANSAENSPGHNKVDTVGKGVFKTAAETFGHKLFNFADSPFMHALSAFAGGAQPLNDKEAQVLLEHVEVIATFAGGQLSTAVNTGKTSATNLASKASKTRVGQTVIDMVGFASFLALRTAVRVGGGKQLIRLAKYFVTSTIEMDKQTAEAENALYQLSGNERLGKLLKELSPTATELLANHVEANGSSRELELWEQEEGFIGAILIWMLQTGAVNLFAHMAQNPIPEVETKARDLGLNQVEKLGYYMFIVISAQLNTLEASIQDDIARKQLVLPDNTKKRIKILKPKFEATADLLVLIAFGNTDNFTKIHRLIISAAKGAITTMLAANYREGQGAAGNTLENLDRTSILQKLSEQVGGEDITTLLDNGAHIIAGRISACVSRKISQQRSNLCPEITDYLLGTPEWEEHFAYIIQLIILKGIAKKMSERALDVTLARIPADTIDNLLCIITNQFNALDKEAIEKANRLTDQEERDKVLCSIFKPAASALYQLIEPEIPLPFPMFTKEPFEKELLESILPLGIAKLHDDWNKHDAVVRQAKKDIREISAHTHAEETCQVLVAFIRDLVPHLLEDEHNSLAQSIIKATKELLTNLRVDAYILANEEITKNILAAHLLSQSRSAEEADIDLFKKQHPAEVRRLVLKNIQTGEGENALNPFNPRAKEIETYLTANQKAIQKLIGENLIELGTKEGLKEVITISLPVVEATIMHSIAAVYSKVKELNELKDANGQPEFLSKLILKWLHTTAEHMQKINKVRVKNKARAAHDVPHTEMVKGFIAIEGSLAPLHEGFPASDMALDAHAVLVKAKKEEKILLRRLRRSKEERQTVKASNENAIRIANAKISLYRRDIQKVEQEIKAAEAILDAEREAYIKHIVEGFMAFAGITSEKDLIAFPEPLRELIYPILKDGLLPKVGLTLYKKFLNPHTKNKILLKILELINETENETGFDKIVYSAPEDETQQALDEALGKVVKQFLSTLPTSMTYATLQIKGINKMTSSAIGRIIRQKLSKDGTLLSYLELALKSVVPNIIKGEWKEDDAQNPVFHPEGDELAFTFPKSIEEKEDASLRLEQEETTVEKLLKKEFAKTVTGQMKVLVRTKRDEIFEYVLKKMILFLGGYVDDKAPEPGEEAVHQTYLGLWAELQATLDDQIENHFGSFGIKAKQMADTVCRLFVITIIGSVLKLVCPPIYQGVFWFIEKYVEHKAQQITKITQIDILEDLYLRILDDLIVMVNMPMSSNLEELVEELGDTTDAWIKEQELYAQEEYDRSNIAHVAALTREMQRIWQEEPNHTVAIQRIAREIRAKISPINSRIEEIPLVGDTILPSQLPSANDTLRAKLVALNPSYDAVRIKADGHCLFRGIGLELLKHLQNGTISKNTLTDKINNTDMEHQEKQDFNMIIDALAGDEAKTPKQVMEDSIDSDLVVKALRFLTCKYNQDKPDLQLALNGELGKDLADYLREMGDMDAENPALGGEPEIEALAKTLGFIICIHDLGLNGDESDQQVYGHEDAEDPKPIIDLLYFAGHYNVARRKVVI